MTVIVTLWEGCWVDYGNLIKFRLAESDSVTQTHHQSFRLSYGLRFLFKFTVTKFCWLTKGGKNTKAQFDNGPWPGYLMNWERCAAFLRPVRSVRSMPSMRGGFIFRKVPQLGALAKGTSRPVSHKCVLCAEPIGLNDLFCLGHAGPIKYPVTVTVTVTK